MPTNIDIRDHHGDAVDAAITFVKGTPLVEVPDVLRLIADRLDEENDAVDLDCLDEVDLDNLEPLSVVAERNRRMLDELEVRWPDIGFMRPIGNGEL